MFDLDRFKSINDRYGHQTGDEVLTVFSRLATSHLRPNDLFGRIGGEEFASLLPDTGHHDAVWLAERVRRAFEASSHPIGQCAIRSTVSVGVAISDEEYSDLSALIAAADRALYRAKALGRNRVEPSPLWAVDEGGPMLRKRIFHACAKRPPCLELARAGGRYARLRANPTHDIKWG